MGKTLLNKKRLITFLLAPLYGLMALIPSTYILAYAESLTVLQQEIKNAINSLIPEDKIIYDVLIKYYKEWVIKASNKIDNTYGSEKEKEYKFKLYLISSINKKIYKLESVEARYKNIPEVISVIQKIIKIFKNIKNAELQNALRLRKLYYPSSTIGNINNDIIKYTQTNWKPSFWKIINKNTISNRLGIKNQPSAPRLSDIFSKLDLNRTNRNNSNSNKKTRIQVVWTDSTSSTSSAKANTNYTYNQYNNTTTQVRQPQTKYEKMKYDYQNLEL